MVGSLLKVKTVIDDHDTAFNQNRYLNLTESEKIKQIEFHFSCIMEVLGLDLTDDSLKDTPRRVANMYVKEVFMGLNEKNFPKISAFNNTYRYAEMLIEKDIDVFSYCENHFMPFIGKVHVAYFPHDRVIGLSKLNRIVRYFSKRPQLQERLTNEIAESLKMVLQNEDVAVFIEAKHLCVAARGIEDSKSTTVTTHLSGCFNSHQTEKAS